MTKSSMPRRVFPPLILIIAPGALAAQSPTPEEAIEAQRAELREVVNQVCPPGVDPGDPNNVVVCGRRELYPRYRVPEAIAEGSRLRETAGGEQRRAMAAGGTACSTVGPMPTGCTSGLNVFAIGAGIARLIGQALENRD